MTAADAANGMNDRHETRVHQEVIKRTGVDMIWEDVTTDKMNLLKASGDLSDVVSDGIAFDRDKEALFKSGQILALDDLIAEYAPDMARDLSLPLELTRKNFGIGDGKIYQVPIMIGEVEREDYPLYLRWEWYKEIGAPEFTTWREYLDIVKQIVDLHPTTDDGQKVYGLGAWTNWGIGTWSYAPNMMSLTGHAGFLNAGGTALGYIDAADNSLITSWDENSPEWLMVEIANKATQLGIYDPDSAIQSADDFNAKRNAGQYVSLFGTWVIRNFNTTHLTEGIGYAPAIPTGGEYYAVGQERNDVGALCMMISKNCSDPAAAMRWLNYVSSYEGNAMLYNGVEGQDWVIGDSGKPELTDSFIADRLAGVSGDDTGIGFSNFFSAFQRVAIWPKYNMPLRFTEDRAVAAQIRSPLEDDYAAYYDVLSFNDAFEKAFESGDLKSRKNLNVGATTLAPAVTSEVLKIGTQLYDLKVQWWNKLSLAKDDAEFAALKQEAIADIENQIDVDTLETFTRDAWDTAQAATIVD
jgi:hypothetical protein